LRPGGDPPRRRRRRGGDARGARPGARRRDRDGGGEARLRGRSPRGRTPAGRRARRGRAEDLRRLGPDVHAGGGLSRRCRRGDVVTAIVTIVRYGLEEALRRKVFVVVLLLTLAFLGLYWLGNHYAFKDLSSVQAPAGIDARTFAGSFIFGLAMFATLFLGVVLAIFLTLGT